MLSSYVSSLLVTRIFFEVRFRNIGVDFTGHSGVKEESTERKMYLPLFTCLSVKTVHIEVFTRIFTAIMLRPSYVAEDCFVICLHSRSVKISLASTT